MPVPTDRQFSFLARVLTYDRNLKARAGNEIVIGVLYQASYSESRTTMEEFTRAVDHSSIQRIRGLTVSYVPLDISSGLPAAGELAQHGVSVLYVTPLNGVDITSIVQLCRDNGITGATGVYEYVEAGLAIGLVPNGSRPPVLINLPAAAEQGADFSSQLLKLAQVLR